ncbi:MAG: chemotaxis protein, partial [Deltaproteobacteria bacterium]|nr:chemotaxis protein [Deltaproteobacteria bacterium]
MSDKSDKNALDAPLPEPAKKTAGKRRTKASIQSVKGESSSVKTDSADEATVHSVAIKEINALLGKIKAGRLESRADVSRARGAEREMLDGINEMLDAVINPLNVAAKYVDEISKGAIPPKITDQYNGDFNTIKNTLNQCIDVVNGLVAEAGMLAKAAVDGKLATRGDAAKFGGDFGKIVKGVNETLDAVIGP